MNLKSKGRVNIIVFLLCLLLQRVVTDLITIYGVIPIYYPERNNTLEMNGLWLSVAALVFLAFICPRDKKKPSTWAYIFMVLALGVPATSVYWTMQRNVNYLYIVLMFFAIMAMILNFSRVKGLRIRELRGLNPDAVLGALFVAYIVACAYLVYKRGGIDSRAFDFKTIYDLREEDNIRGLAGYLKNWCVKMFFPFFLLYWFEKKKYLRSALCVVLQLLLYLSFGEKTTLFSIAFVSGVYLVYRKKWMTALFVAFCAIVAIPLIIYLTTGEYSLFSSLSRRFCFIPSQIGFNYYDFFSQGNPFLWLSETMFGRVFGMSSPYPDIFSYYISGGNGMANTGVIADAYANGGIVMCVIFAIVLGVVFLVYDNILEGRRHKNVIVAILGYSCINLMDNGLLTSLLTNGMLLTLAISLLLPDESNEDQVQKKSSVKRKIRFKI